MSRPLRSEIVTELKASGWDVQIRKAGHLMAKHPEASGVMFLAASPSDRRAAANTRSVARRLLADNTEEHQ